MPRLFFALWPDEDVRRQIAALAQRLPIRKGRPVAYDNWHLTLAFLGDVQAHHRQVLLSGAAQITAPGFSLRLDRSGWWPGSEVFWLAPAVIPDALGELVGKLKALVQARALPLARRPYRPHVTLARGVTAPPVQAQTAGLEPILWNIRDFCLLESISGAAGVRYEALEIWPLSSG